MSAMTTSSIAPVIVAEPVVKIQRKDPVVAPAPVTPVAATSAPEVPTAATAEPKLEQVQLAIERLKQSIKPSLSNTLEFQIDDSTGRTLVKILDTETQKVVRQVPSEEMLIIARALDRMQGRGGLVKQEA